MTQVVSQPATASVALSISQLVQNQRNFFNSGQTKSYEFRLAQLTALRQAVMEHEAEIIAALQADLGKPMMEAYGSEFSLIKSELDIAIRNLQRWMQPKRVKPSAAQLPSQAQIIPEPLGVVLIIAPWNYPFQLLLAPAIGAIAAGNCVLLKPSEIAAHTSRLVANLIGKLFDPSFVAVAEGGVEVSQAVLQERFDHICYTGSGAIAKIVMQAAAQHLTPVTLELGGKSPCIVDTDIDLACTARRIVWGKCYNAGQTCVAPDYLLVNRNIKAQLIEAMRSTIQDFFGDNPANSPDYARIISDRHFTRLTQLMNAGTGAGTGAGTIVIGGETDSATRYIAPTVIDHVSAEAAVMQDEIFGPILPVLEYGEMSEAIAFINARPKPLALYLFSNSKDLQNQVLQTTSSGSVCINDTIMQIASENMPFGGVGESGMGCYRGKYSFETFSHYKSVLSRPFWLDVNVRYAPYADKFKWFKLLVK
jgi:aldehyde dehydrogenase (NAD+)